MEGYLGRYFDIFGDLKDIFGDIFGDLTRYHWRFMEILIGNCLDIQEDDRRCIEILVGYMVGDHLDKYGDLYWRSLGYQRRYDGECRRSL